MLGLLEAESESSRFMVVCFESIDDGLRFWVKTTLVVHTNFSQMYSIGTIGHMSRTLRSCTRESDSCSARCLHIGAKTISELSFLFAGSLPSNRFCLFSGVAGNR